MVKKVRERISDLDRCTLEALIVLDVHNKDVIELELAKAGIDKPSDFNWQA